MMPVTDEELMQHADGVLDAARAAAITRAIAEDPELALRHRQLSGARAALSRAVAAQALPPASEAMIDRIRALQAGAVPRPDIGSEAPAAAAPPIPPSSVSPQAGSTVIDLRTRRAVLAPVLSGALAAGLAIACIGLGAGYMLGKRGAADMAEGVFLGQPGLAEALDTLGAGSERALPSGAMVRAVSSFKDEQGRLCREVAIRNGDAQGMVAIACAEGQGWGMQLVVTTAAGEDAYVPASALETLDAWFSATGAGSPLSVEAEAEALLARKAD